VAEEKTEKSFEPISNGFCMSEVTIDCSAEKVQRIAETAK